MPERIRARITEIHPESVLHSLREQIVGQVFELSEVNEERNDRYAGRAAPGWDCGRIHGLSHLRVDDNCWCLGFRYEEVREEPVRFEVTRTPVPGDRIRITDIHPNSSHYPSRHHIIGQTLTVAEWEGEGNRGSGWHDAVFEDVPDPTHVNRCIWGFHWEWPEEQITSSPLQEQPMSLPRNAIFLSPDGGAYKASFSRLEQRQVDEALKKAATSGHQRLMDVSFLNDMPVTIAHNPQQIIVGVDLPKLPMLVRCVMREGYLSPVFRSERDSIQVNAVWTPPASCRLRVAVVLKPEKPYKIHTTLFFARSSTGEPGGFFRLPLPNIFNDGRMCMGDHFRGQPSEQTLEGCLKHAIRHLAESPWGTDMMPDRAKIDAMFRFDPATMQNLPITGDWHTHCYRVNRVEMEALFPTR